MNNTITKTTTKLASDLIAGDQVVNGERSFGVVDAAVPFEHFLLTDQVRVWGVKEGKYGWVEFAASHTVTIKA